jgi:hypothetical protein
MGLAQAERFPALQHRVQLCPQFLNQLLYPFLHVCSVLKRILQKANFILKISFIRNKKWRPLNMLTPFS